jgi:putative oxidoreductase
MKPLLGRFSEEAYGLMRIVVGFLFSCHGAQKLFGVLGGKAELHNPMMVTAGAIEFIGGILIAIGLLTSITAFLASGEMAAGYFMVHASHGFFPIINKGELAVLYCFVFLFMAAKGGGRWSIDALMNKSRRTNY